MRYFFLALTMIFVSIFFVANAEVGSKELVGSNINDKMETLEIFHGDEAFYPYIVLGEVRSEGLTTDHSLEMLKEKAIQMGADALLNYRNKADYGFTAEGLAVRWVRE